MKTFLKIIVALLALLILTIMAIPFLVSAETLKLRVADELSKATGRTITIEGAASLQVFPDIAVSLEKVTLGNPTGDFASERMFFANKLATGVRLMPLLNKEIIITGVTLEGAEINLEESKGGLKNWEFASKPASDTKQEQAAEKGRASTFAIGDITVKDSTLNYSPATGPSIALGKINLTLSGADGNGPLALDGDAEYNGETVNVSLDVKDSRGFLNGTPSDIVADISLPGGALAFSGTAEKKTDIGAKGNLKVDVASLPALMQWATGKKPADKLPKQLALKGLVTVSGKRISFSQLEAQADDIRTSGSLAIDLTGTVPSLNGTLALGHIDLARFSNAPAAQGDAPAAGNDGWSSQPMDLSGLKAVNAQLALTLEGLKSGKLDIGATALDVNLQGGALKLGIGKMALYSGNASGTVSLSPAGIATALDITGVQIEPLLVALTGKSRLTATAALDLNLRGNGASQQAIVSSLGGTATMKFRDGKLKGINLGEFLRNARQGKFYADDSQSTDFAELGGSWNFAGGIGTNNDLALKAPILRMTGTGTVNLPNRSVHYRLLPTLVASSKGQDGKDKSGLTIPLSVTGPWTKPSITPDIAGILQEGLRDPDALKQNLDTLKEGFKGLNSPSDIGKALLGGGTAKPAATGTTTPAPATSEPAATSAPATEPAPPPAKDAREQAIEGLFNVLSQ